MKFDFSQEPGLKRRNRDLIKTAQPVVSIITPYYNGAKHIQQTCNCILDQTFPFFEWIIVNDGSTREEDVQMLDIIAGQDSRIRVLHKENGGISSARNFGIQHACTQYVLPIDGDDLLEPTFVEYCWWMLTKNPECAWAYTDSVGFGGMEYLWKEKFDPIRLKSYNHLTHCALIRKDAILAIGGYAEKYKHYNEDWYAWLRLVGEGGYPAQSCGDFLMWYRRSDSGVFSIVKNDREIAKANRKLIASAAAKVIRPHDAVFFPAQFQADDAKLHPSSWERVIHSTKHQTHVCVMLGHFEADGGKHHLDLLAGLDPAAYELGVLVTDCMDGARLQQLRRFTPDVFQLSSFVAPQDEAEFISYYLKSRQIDVLFISGSEHGYDLLPWLRQHFPELVIVDDNHEKEARRQHGGRALVEKTCLSNCELEELIKDGALRSRRLALSESLRSLSPLSEELFLMELQLQHAQAQTLPAKLKRAKAFIRQKGIKGMAKGTLGWLRRRLS